VAHPMRSNACAYHSCIQRDVLSSHVLRPFQQYSHLTCEQPVQPNWNLFNSAQSTPNHKYPNLHLHVILFRLFSAFTHRELYMFDAMQGDRQLALYHWLVAPPVRLAVPPIETSTAFFLPHKIAYQYAISVASTLAYSKKVAYHTLIYKPYKS
jgi:hypothetical protein